MTTASAITTLFPTSIYRAELPGMERLNLDLEGACLGLSQHDRKGQAWCETHGYAGYTSYGSITNLAEQSQPFHRLERIIARHALAFAQALHWDLQGGKPFCDSLWVNVLPPGGAHSSHIHTNAVLSGTYYVNAPEGASPISFEDPRHALMMAAPPRKAKAPRDQQTYVTFQPRAGTLMLWESWLRHEVPLNRAQSERISVSFNMVIG
jgi:uncharacterized protein (TIGR02466 family)